MQEIETGSWEEFEVRVANLRKDHHSLANATAPLLFRGQGNADRNLATTLERAGHKNMTFTAYYEAITRATAEIETLLNTSWDLPSYPEIAARLRTYDGLRVPLPTPVYRYLLFLRQHGFPSPLLDWTRSPYVAAYFAFRSAARPACGNVSIHVFSEMPEGGKHGGSDTPWIIRVGQYIRSHRRHFLQQSDYSICVLFDQGWKFVPHAEVFERSEPDQDVLIKITVPWIERLKVLKLLDDHNLNAFSLFSSEESLMETMALRVLDFRIKTSPEE